nr:MAG TPA: hypothetical protein [Caudoviricetes sp.]
MELLALATNHLRFSALASQPFFPASLLFSTSSSRFLLSSSSCFFILHRINFSPHSICGGSQF